MDTNTDIENIINSDKPIMINENKYKLFINDLIKLVGTPTVNPTNKEIEQCIASLRKKYKVSPSKEQLRYIIDKYYNDTFINIILRRFMIKKACRSMSGVLVATIVLRPDVFSCPHNCSYCPTETNLEGTLTQPKSYLSSEPAMLRALQYNFEVIGQLWDRIYSYIKTGNIVESTNSYKLEIIISGGTWESYPYDYRKQVMNELYWAANIFTNNKLEPNRDMLTIEEEITINETAKYRIIGITLETRPDFITNQSIRDYRKWGITRMQIGVQHYDNTILKGINRECYTKDTIKAIKMLKETGFKVVCHLMPDLPGSSPEKDRWMFDQAIHNPDLQFDDVKIYPTAVCKSSDPNLIVKSDIAELYKNNLYIPYAETNLKDLVHILKEYKKNIQPWIRIQRLVRDIPEKSIEAGYKKKGNLRQLINDEMIKEGIKCNCIRCMEIGDDSKMMESTTVVVREYIASGGKEYFISIESHEKVSIFTIDFWKYIWFIITYYYYFYIYNKETFWSGNLKTYNGLIGFCRLRIDPNPGGGIIKELENCSLIREVHVYGQSLGIGNVNTNIVSSQHRGYGKKLVKVAEIISHQNYINKVAVIAGVGTREYYKNKCGYILQGTYMIKHI